jgi:hypothetical protein
MLHNELLRIIQAHLLGFSTGNVLSWKRFCLFCLFHMSLSFAGCLVQLVYTKFPSRVFHTSNTGDSIPHYVET